jgi:hypothetical protein
VDTVREPLIVLDKGLRVVAASRSFYVKFSVDPRHTQGRRFYELGDHEWDIPKLRLLLEPRADSQAPSGAMAGSAAKFGVSAPPAIGHARSWGVFCEMVGASVACSTANAFFPFAAQSARACSP